ncbi:MAG: hypothetical protein AB7F98_05930 [Novosphingobium sp.]
MPSDYPLFPLDDSHYPFPHMYVDLVVLTIRDGAMQVLVRREGDEVYGSRYILPGAFVHERKSLEWTAAKIAKSKAMLDDVELEPLQCFSKPDRDSRAWVVSFPWLVLVLPHELRPVVDMLPERHLMVVKIDPFCKAANLWLGPNQMRVGLDHAEIISAAVTHLCDGLDWSLLPFRLLPEVFSLRQLQQVHEAILGYPIDKATLRKRMLARTFADGRRLIATGEMERGSHRPATLFRVGYEYDDWAVASAAS